MTGLLPRLLLLAMTGLATAVLTGCHAGRLCRVPHHRCRVCRPDGCVADARGAEPPCCDRSCRAAPIAPAAPPELRGPATPPKAFAPPAPGNTEQLDLPPQAGQRPPRTILQRVRFGLRKLHSDDDETTSEPAAVPRFIPPTSESAIGHVTPPPIATRPAKLGTTEKARAIEPWPYHTDQNVPRSDGSGFAEPTTLRQPPGPRRAWQYQSAQFAPREAGDSSALPRLHAPPPSSKTATSVWRSGTGTDSGSYNGEHVIRNFE